MMDSNRTPKVLTIGEKKGQLDCFRIKSFCSEEDAIKRVKRQAGNRRSYDTEQSLRCAG